MNWNGTALPVGPAIANFQNRDIDAARMRKRYFRGSTSMKGA